MKPQPDTHGIIRHVPQLALDWLESTPTETWRVVDGTLLFGDISGFTALAERLAQQGRQGGEELVSTLGRVFGSMLDAAAARGGDMLKFGGDALLLFFQGDNHAEQAASAAVEMRKTLIEAARKRTSAGALKLSMSIGIHSSPVHFFLVGTAHRELIILGPAINRVIDLEKQASAGEVLLSTATASLLPCEATEDLHDGKHRLRWRVPRTSAAATARHQARDDALVATLFPTVLGRYLAEGTPEPEHRVACISFVGFSGTDALLADKGPDALAEALHTILSAAQECLEAEGVTLLAVDVDQDGGKLFLAAGVPTGNEDDEGVMMRALRQLADRSLPLPLRIGVNRGHVFAAEVGTATRAAYSAMGDTTNTAARIMGKAPPGAIFVHACVLDECLVLYETKQVGPFTFKGKAEAVTLYQVGKEIGPRQREGLEIDSFIGRQEPLALLSSAIDRLQAGSGAVITIAGATGIGKTRLITEAMATASIDPALSMVAEPYGTTRPYHPFRSPLRKLLHLDPNAALSLQEQLHKRVALIAPNLLPLLSLVAEVVQVPMVPGPAVTSLDPSFHADRTASAVIELINNSLMIDAGPGPQILVMEGAHWSDEASVYLLQKIAEAAPRHGWLLLVSRRDVPGGFRPAATEQLNLLPMPDQQIKAIIDLASEAAPFRSQDASKIVARASGNPMFALELVKAARELGSFANIPETLEAALSAQVDALDPSAKRMLRYAAVLGRRFSLDALHELITSDGDTFDQSTLLRLQYFVEPDGQSSMRFRNGVIRDITYEGISFQRRRHLHQQIAQAMERKATDMDAMTNELALHFSLAGDARKTWLYARLAAQAAGETYANADGAKLYEMALHAASNLPDLADSERRDVWRKLTVLRERAGLFDAARESLRSAISLCGDNRIDRAELVCMRGILKDRTRSFSAALRDMNAGTKLLSGDTSARARRCRAELMAWAANISYGQDRLKLALELSVAAEREARKARHNEPLARALSIRGSTQLMLEGPVDDTALLHALSLFESLGNTRMQANIRSNLGIFCAMAGRWSDARDWMTSARDTFIAAGDDTSAVFPAIDLAEMLLKQRHYQQAEVALVEALRLAKANTLEEGVDEGELLLVQVYVACNRVDEAKNLLPRIEQSFAAAGQTRKVLETKLVSAAILRRQDQAPAALAYLDKATRSAPGDTDSLVASIALLRALILEDLQRLDEAEDEIALGVSYAQATAMPFEEAMLREARIALRRKSGRPIEPEDPPQVQSILANLGVVSTGPFAEPPSHQEGRSSGGP